MEARCQEEYGYITTHLTISTDMASYSPSGSVRLTGSVTDYNGNGLPEMKVTMSSDFGYSSTLNTDDLGRFGAILSAPSEEGQYHIVVWFAGVEPSGKAGYASAGGFVSFRVGNKGISVPMETTTMILGVAVIILGMTTLWLLSVRARASRNRKFCVDCGTANPPTTNFCGMCGRRLKEK